MSSQKATKCSASSRSGERDDIDDIDFVKHIKRDQQQTDEAGESNSLWDDECLNEERVKVITDRVHRAFEEARRDHLEMERYGACVKTFYKFIELLGVIMTIIIYHIVIHADKFIAK
jgi:hypothetical protein